MALAAVGQQAGFAEIGAHVLDVLLPADLTLQRGAAVDHVLAAFSALSVHPDVPDGLRALREQGLRVVTLSNGAASVAQGLLERAGVADLVEATLSVADAGVWKPAAAAYAHAVRPGPGSRPVPTCSWRSTPGTCTARSRPAGRVPGWTGPARRRTPATSTTRCSGCAT